MHVCVCVIVWHKGSLTASNSLSSGSCCRVGAWWPIPPAPYFSFNDAQINSSTLFQNSFSPLIPRPLGILTSTSPFHPDARPSTTHSHLPLLGLLSSSPSFSLSSDMVLFKHVYLDSLSHFFLTLGNGNFFTCNHEFRRYLLPPLHPPSTFSYHSPFLACLTSTSTYTHWPLY